MDAPLQSFDLLAQPGGLEAFARANGFAYAATAEPPALGDSLWEQATSGVVRDRISGTDWELGRITGGSRSATSVEQRGGFTVTKTVSVSTPERSRNIGYFAMTLPRRLPQMVLDARSNDRGPFSSLIHRPSEHQALSLEGDFDRYFRLYAPAGYERDALFVFTPDVMALLIDETGDLDVEIRDNRLFVYAPQGFDLDDARVWQRLARIRTVLAAQVSRQTARYVDEQLPGLAFDADTVGAGGRRLRRRLPMWVWLAIGIPVVVLAVLGTIAAIVLTAVLPR
ncbi:hypothetical protein [Leucobacter musarum]|uniref:hypothetical protein n=1 Tax=Leucobacter musarum TaxID=1930747 RepID=UPI0006A7C4A0|nr:hypothetical protein [Leucobacter musarum]